MLIRQTFEPVKHHVRKKGRCPVCGKVTTRQKVFFQTLSRYNKNADGMVKTSSEIHVELTAEGKAWQPDFTHERCRVAP